MPHTPVAAIAGLGVDAVELTHALGQIAVRRLNQQVVVVIHQAPGMAYPVESGNDLSEGREEQQTVLVVLKDIFLPIPARSDVIERIGKFQAEGAGHNEKTITGILLLS